MKRRQSANAAFGGERGLRNASNDRREGARKQLGAEQRGNQGNRRNRETSRKAGRWKSSDFRGNRRAICEANSEAKLADHPRIRTTREASQCASCASAWRMVRRFELRRFGSAEYAVATAVRCAGKAGSRLFDPPDEEMSLSFGRVFQVLLLSEDESMVDRDYREVTCSVNRNRYHLSKFRV